MKASNTGAGDNLAFHGRHAGHMLVGLRWEVVQRLAPVGIPQMIALRQWSRLCLYTDACGLDSTRLRQGLQH